MDKNQQQEEIAASISILGNTSFNKKVTLIHALSFTIYEFGNSKPQLEQLTVNLFKIPFSSFHEKTRDKYSKNRKDYYSKTYSYHDMINIYTEGYGYNTNSINIEIKGSACDELDLDFYHITNYIYNVNCHVTELHLANDDHNNILNMTRLYKAFIEETYTSSLKYLNWPKNKNSKDNLLIFGKSPRIIFYDRRGSIRCEIQLRNELAHNALFDFYKGEDLGLISKGLLFYYLKFRNGKEKDKNMSRRSIAPWWNRFLGDVAERKYEKAKPESNIINKKLHLKRYFQRRVEELGEINVVEVLSEILPHWIITDNQLVTFSK